MHVESNTGLTAELGNGDKCQDFVADCGDRVNLKIPGAVADKLNFAKWCSFLTVSVLRTRTPFSAFLLSTLHLSQSDVPSSSPTFPLPIPYPGVFAKMPSGLSSAKRKRLRFHRALHVGVMALNFWWSGSSFISLELLRRTPSAGQLRILRRLAGLMLADGPLEEFEVLRSGRRIHHLFARLCELSEFVTKLGAGSGPYEKTYPGHSVPLDSSRFAELEPYKSLDATRLKVTGRGNFDASEFLEPELCMAYRFPDSLLFDHMPHPGEYPAALDPMEEVLSLAKLWDVYGLLHLRDVNLQKAKRHELVRVFNCRKSSTVDRQIGDRRGRNLCECRVKGPSSSLPTGPDLLSLYLDEKVDALSIICTDRKDFYHQFATTTNRTLSNTIGPMVKLSDLSDTHAFAEMQKLKRSKKPPRQVAGDSLGQSERQCFERCPAGYGMISFKSIFQGDHAGVEIATASHQGLLRSVGLLTEQTQLQSDRPFMGDRLCEGLVIDDYFAIAKTRRSVLVQNPDDVALTCLGTAKRLYESHNILGSDDKDIKGEPKAKIIGASVDASHQTVSRGHVLVAAPAAKRYALAWLTLQLCQLTHTTDALHLCVVGGFTSAMMFRRPFMSLLQKSFQLVDMSVFSADDPKLVKLTRHVANELTLLSVLMPFCATDITAAFSAEVFATDASIAKGAITSCSVDSKTAEVLWKSCKSKGGYSKLLTPNQALLSRCLDFEEAPEAGIETIKRPLAYRFEFVEIFAGAATVTKAMASRGFSVCCPIDISFDPELNVSKVHVVEWLIHLVSNHLVLAWMLEPPCTTFSKMRRPALRSKSKPFGFNLLDPQTQMGTILAHRALQVLVAAHRSGVSGVLENLWTSKIKFLPAWKDTIRLEHVEMVRCDSCAYGSVRQKSFLFLCCWVEADADAISLRCSGDHAHVPVQGSLTKKSATYVPALAEALADVMAAGVKRLRSFNESLDEIKVEGLESQLVNEICLSSQWKVVSSWTFKVTLHINLLELSAVIKLVMMLVKRGIAVRVVILVDSNVVRCAAAKGRSSSKTLGKALARLAALCIGGGIYPVFGFCPTRLNSADDPTRDFPLKLSIPGFDFAAWDRFTCSVCLSSLSFVAGPQSGFVSSFTCLVQVAFNSMTSPCSGPRSFLLALLLVFFPVVSWIFLPWILTPRWDFQVKVLGIVPTIRFSMLPCT